MSKRRSLMCMLIFFGIPSFFFKSPLCLWCVDDQKAGQWYKRGRPSTTLTTIMAILTVYRIIKHNFESLWVHKFLRLSRLVCYIVHTTITTPYFVPQVICMQANAPLCIQMTLPLLWWSLFSCPMEEIFRRGTFLAPSLLLSSTHTIKLSVLRRILMHIYEFGRSKKKMAVKLY